MIFAIEGIGQNGSASNHVQIQEANDWLVEPPEELTAWAQSIGMSSSGALDVEVRLSAGDLESEGSLLVDLSFGCVRMRSADLS